MTRAYRGEGFHAVLDSVLPRGGTLVVLKAYLDASLQNGTFCIAGYAFTKGQVKKFDAEWWELFREYGGCHMTDLHNRYNAFEGISDQEAARLIIEAVKIINRRISYGVVISCHVAELDPLLVKSFRGFEGAYPVCCSLVMQRLGLFVSEAGTQQIAYFFENGDEYEAAAHDFLKSLVSTPGFKASYRHASHTFISKDDALALQSADILAWEWARFMDAKVTNKMPMRKSLIALLTKNGQFNGKQYVGTHVTGEPLRKWAANTEKIMFQQIDEQAMERAANQLRHDWEASRASLALDDVSRPS